jgi:hypothetical protein
MGRSKEMGKPVGALMPSELQRERKRCRTLIEIYGNRIASKGIRKRLYEIEKRLTKKS